MIPAGIQIQYDLSKALNPLVTKITTSIATIDNKPLTATNKAGEI